MKIGILGCGYVGSAVAASWKDQGHQVVVTTRNPEKLTSLQNCSSEVYVLKGDDFSDFMQDLDILLISVAPNSHSSYEDTYLKTAQAVVKALPHCTHLKKVYYTSSTSVYGEHHGGWVDEETPTTPLHTNQECLIKTEETLLQATSQQTKMIILRLGEIIGPGRLIIDRLKRSQNQTFPGTGNNFTNLTHLVDIVNATHHLANENWEGIYNLCSDLHITRRELYDDLCLKYHLSPIQWNPLLPPLHGGNKRVSSQKILTTGFVFS